MTNPWGCYLLLLHIWWDTWVQGDLRKLYVAGGENKGDINPGRYRLVYERQRLWEFRNRIVRYSCLQNVENSIKIVQISAELDLLHIILFLFFSCYFIFFSTSSASFMPKQQSVFLTCFTSLSFPKYIFFIDHFT